MIDQNREHMTLRERQEAYRKQIRFLQNEIELIEAGLKVFGNDDDFMKWMTEENKNLGAKPIDIQNTIIVLDELNNLLKI